MSSLDRQSLCRDPGCFARMRAIWRGGGVHWTYLLSLHCRATVVRTSRSLHDPHVERKVLLFLEMKSVFGNVVLPLKKIVGVFMRVLIWTTRQKAFHEGEKFSSSQLIVFIKHLLKIKENDFLPRNLAKGRWVLCAYVVIWSSTWIPAKQNDMMSITRPSP